ncbi:MAG: hypothetical protein M1837_000418 [Sclerophora amabilis]|nr:MAG: hypothetical protein M1837_000418 [Sclerophora amabilis]
MANSTIVEPFLSSWGTAPLELTRMKEYNASPPWKVIFLLLVPVYLAVIEYLRFERVRRMHKKFPYSTRESLSKMTVDDAFLIQRYIAELEFPAFYEKGLQFPLFKTYGLPSMSRLLVQTKELSKPTSATKRLADTVILITEFIANPPRSERTLNAIARMNYIHSLYQKPGLITQDDLLYTLGLFAIEPIRWINRFEWRQLTDMERCAFGITWKSIGDAMGIEYAGRLSCVDEDGHGTWTDGLHWLEDVTAWCDQFEESHLVPDPNNKEIADLSVDLILWNIPARFKRYGRKIITVLMDERLRKAVMYPAPPAHYVTLTMTFLRVRKFIMRHLMPPRPTFLRRHDLHDTADPQTGRYTFRNFLDHPWYVKPSFLGRWGVGSWFTRLLGGTLPGGEGGGFFRPQGYAIGELGPMRYEKMGKRETIEETRRLGQQRAAGSSGGGCPFKMG